MFEALKGLGGPDWFQLGDKDLALHLARAALLAAGQDLTGVTAALGEGLGVPAHVTVIPATMSPVRTRVVTEQGDMAFQEYFVAQRCAPVLSRRENRQPAWPLRVRVRPHRRIHRSTAACG